MAMCLVASLAVFGFYATTKAATRIEATVQAVLIKSLLQEPQERSMRTLTIYWTNGDAATVYNTNSNGLTKHDWGIEFTTTGGEEWSFPWSSIQKLKNVATT